jgi:hypothetical protein
LLDNSLTFQQINQLLELKQKQANASEARTTRMQAKENDRQGKVIFSIKERKNFTPAVAKTVL